MIAFGIMTLSMESESGYINEMAVLAADCGIDCYRFIPSKINPHSLQVQGKKFDSVKRQWADQEFILPSLIYDRCFYGDDRHSKQCMPIVSWLKSRADITFLGYGLPNKMELYQALNSSVLAAYLPSTQLIKDTKTVVQELDKLKKLIIKPINGSQGYGIYYLQKISKTYLVKTEKNKEMISRAFPNTTKLTSWLRTLITQRSYLLQPYLELSNAELQPFDIRILLQKNELGDWVERGKGVRIGNKAGLLSNLSAGGSSLDFSTWTEALPVTKKELICNEIDYIIKQLPALLERKFLPLFEIGIDIGIAKNGTIWILDVNSKPGRKVILQTQSTLNETLLRAPLLYGKHLFDNNSKERKSYSEKTLYY
ncbi:YheC/YheD family protein [Bacillus sp. MRMR6]|uniref:YheC/YheD family endospore coat-associated protein n=1 Tax=Bacillus sp. MRMR6 TaxID=1928617 RepID=UPI000952B0A7|nr:YheC/YheD family protein [Bacillus sp. MRMR6]OLS36448.1 hypothetical protein BTR25_17655 [Bacillus sp. MRMR6]